MQILPGVLWQLFREELVERHVEDRQIIRGLAVLSLEERPEELPEVRDALVVGGDVAEGEFV